MAKKVSGPEDLYVGVDVGGTKTLACLVAGSGAVLDRVREPTPREDDPEPTLAVIERVIQAAIDSEAAGGRKPAGIGVGIPGVVDVEEGRIVVAPNMSITGVTLTPRLAERFGLPVALGNDVNFGTLGEAWLGAGRDAPSVVGMFIGTGIGGGFVRDGQIWRGARESALEIGHMVMGVGGPKCGCGARGCLEAYASRSAMERALRKGIKSGADTSLDKRLAADDRGDEVIRSGILADSLEEGDRLVRRVLGDASEMIGYACLNIRHVIDPEVIVLGGGVIEACSETMLPIIEKVVASDPLAGSRESMGIRIAALGDDAVVLGAVAAAIRQAGGNPLADRRLGPGTLPAVSLGADEGHAVGGKRFETDFYVRVTGKAKKRKKRFRKGGRTERRVITAEELEKVCRGGPELLLIGATEPTLTDSAERFLRLRRIERRICPPAEAVGAFNDSDRRRALLVIPEESGD